MNDYLNLGVSEAENFKALLRFVHNKVCPARYGKKRINHSHRYRTKKLHILQQQDFRCLDCDKFINEDTATFEHIIPYRFGSTMSDLNIVLLCGKCNRKRDQHFNKIGFMVIEDHYGPIDWDALRAIPITEIYDV